MPTQSTLAIEDFLSLASDLPIFDARTPAEFARAHIPGAHNLPIFLDEHRVTIGTLYKKQGRDKAILEGLELVGPRMRGLVESVMQVVGPPEECAHPVLVHCWRGGMRSGALAWLLSFYGYEVITLEGGYKSFRRWAQAQFSIPKQITILGGYTGSGKTLMLYHLERSGEQIVDLEGCANHRGSAFGSLCLPAQPTTEHFENRLAMIWHALDGQRRTWIEDESHMVGACRLPETLFEQMRAAPVVAPLVSREMRLQRLVEIYGEAEPAELVACFERLRKRLGDRDMRAAIALVEQDDLAGAAAIALTYYDKTYAYGMGQRPAEQITQFDVGELPIEDITRTILSLPHEPTP